MIEISTNNRVRALRSLNEIPEDARKDFDYLRDPDEARLVKLGINWYDTQDTQAIRLKSTSHTDPIGWAMYVEARSPLAKWNAVISESHWTGVLFRFKGDGVVCGTYHEKG